MFYTFCHRPFDHALLADLLFAGDTQKIHEGIDLLF